MHQKRSAAIAALFLFTLILTACHMQHSTVSENRRFETYTHTLFCQEVSGNSIALHYTLKNPDAYGIQPCSASLGTVVTDTASVCAALENAQSLLSSFTQTSFLRKTV